MERDTVLEMADTKCNDINKYLNKEIHYLEELINKANTKQIKDVANKSETVGNTCYDEFQKTKKLEYYPLLLQA